MYICYILPVPANDIAIENIFFYTFWFKYSTSIYKYIFNLCHYCPVKAGKSVFEIVET